MAKPLFLLVAILFLAGIIVAAKSERPTITPQSVVAVEYPPGADMTLIQARLGKAFKAQPDDIAEAPIPGYLEVLYGSDIFYISYNGNHLFDGDVYDLLTLDNLTEQRRALDRWKIISAIPEETMIVYRALNEKYVLNVFTDIDCVYCRKLHQDMAQFNALGITVRYLAYPRAGLDSPSYNKAVSVWCNKDRKLAMDRAKAQEPVEAMNCDAPVAMHMQQARLLGINSTPALILENGRLQRGYVPASQLLAMYQSLIPR